MVTLRFAVCGLRFAVSHEKPDAKGPYCPVKSLVENLLSEIKYTDRGSALLKQSNYKEEKKIAFCDTIPTLTVYYNRGSNEKKESYTRPTATSPNF